MRLKLIHQDSVNINRSIKESEIIVNLGVSKINKNQLCLEFDAEIGDGKNSRMEVKFVFECYLDNEENELDPRKLIEENIDQITKYTIPLIVAVDKVMEEKNLNLENEKTLETEEELLMN